MLKKTLPLDENSRNSKIKFELIEQNYILDLVVTSITIKYMVRLGLDYAG